MPHLTLSRIALFMIAVAAAGCARRPDFSLDRAHVDLAAAFERPPRQIAIYSDSRSEDPDEWLIEFRIDGIDPSLEARFKGTKEAWVLADVREAPRDSAENPPWESVGVLLGRIRGESRTRALETVARMRQLSDLIGQYAVRNGNRFPDVGMSGLRQLLIADGGIQEGQWKHDSDAWGQELLYHAAPDGQNYILISKGADGQLDQDEATYFRNADQGLEAYAGRSTNADADIIVASGGFVQAFEE